MSLSKEKQELLALLLAEEGLEETAEQRIRPLEDRSQLPLGFAQERLWFLYQLMPDDPSYNISTNVRLEGNLHVERLEQSFNEIVRRHEALRTNFLNVSGQPRVIVHEALALTMERIDLRHLAEPSRSEEVARLFRAEALKPFNLSTDPLIRATLLQLTEGEHVLLLTIHHIVSDGWSMGVFLQELGSIYEAFCEGKASPLPELEVQYADFAHWQREAMQGEALAEQVGFWRNLLRGELPVLQLPTDHPRPKVKSGKGHLKRFDLPQDVIDRLTEIAARQEATLYQILLAAFNVLLHRYSGQDDILVGAPIANRNRREAEGLIGFLANTVMFRTDLSGDPTFRELLGRVRDMARGVYAHQDLPFAKLVEELSPDRNTGNTPLSQVFFVLQNAPMPALELAGLRLSLMEMESATAKFDLSIYIMEEQSGPIGMLEYSTDLFEHETIDRMIRHFLILLAGIADHPDLTLSALPMLSAEEERMLLADWSQGGTLAAHEGWPDACIHELVEAQAARTPDATAVIFEGSALTYAELNKRANQLAHRLRGTGVGKESLVAVCLDRSLEMPVALLGVMKAGAGYVPLDMKMPEERLRFILEETEARVLLTQERFFDRLPVQAGLHVIALDAVDLSEENAGNPQAGTGADNIAYVIYTSGSTGLPKGVLVPHRGVVNRLLWGQERLPMTSEDRVLQKAPYTFDASVWEIFWPLSMGAAVVFAKPEGQSDAAYLVRVMKEQGITITHFVPSMLHHFFEEKGVPEITSLRRVIVGGEALTYDLQERFFSRLGAKLYNLYGPTETSIEVTAWECVPESPRRIVPIGRPIANAEAYVLDRNLRPVPVGVPGELYLGGACVTRGYLKRPELTEGAYVPHPFSDEPGARLYKTGDLVRWLGDGNLEYLGRIDHQVKLRGFRVELGEIEAVLAEHPSVRETVVLVREDEPGDKRLVAYIVPTAAEQAPTISDVRRYLLERLPEYMAPTHLVILDAMPLTSSGKANRRALPAPGLLRPVMEQEYVAPQNEREAQLAKMFQALLHVERVGVNDNFFELGGHSLKATELMAHVTDAFGVELPLARLFEEPTVAGLSRLIEESQQSASRADEPQMVALSRNRTRRPVKGEGRP